MALLHEVQAGVRRSRLDARQHAFQQRIGDLRRAVQLLEEGLQHGECRRNPDQLRALQTLTERSYRTCMIAHDEHFKPVRWPQNGAPVYLKGKYSEETLRKALDIVNSSMWPEFPAQGPPLMYACRGPFQRWDRNETHEMKLILQAALEIARDQGKFERLERLCRKGRSAWTFPFFFDGGKVGRYEFVYEKSAGDCVCSFWIRKHMKHSGLNWLTNDLLSVGASRSIGTVSLSCRLCLFCFHMSIMVLISFVSPFSSRWTIQARVTVKSDLRTFNRNCPAAFVSAFRC